MYQKSVVKPLGYPASASSWRARLGSYCGPFTSGAELDQLDDGLVELKRRLWLICAGRQEIVMVQASNRRIVLASRPEGEPGQEHFRLETVPLPEPGPGQLLVRILWLSLDPYMRGRMSAAKSYAKPVEIGQTMEGGTVAEVVASQHPDYAPGDFVLSHSGWQEYAVADGGSVRQLDPSLAPLSAALGVLGMPGMTSCAGLLSIWQPKPGETVV